MTFLRRRGPGKFSPGRALPWGPFAQTRKICYDRENQACGPAPTWGGGPRPAVFRKGCCQVEEQNAQNKKREMTPFYRFVSLYQDYITQTRDYGDGVQRSMVEMHILAIVCGEPGITVGQVAQQWGRTKGAASQNVTKLEKQGLVVRAKHVGNAREVHLYPTKEGRQLAALHAVYDERNEKEFAERLMAKCTVSELQTFTRVIEVYSDILEEDLASAR